MAGESWSMSGVTLLANVHSAPGLQLSTSDSSDVNRWPMLQSVIFNELRFPVYTSCFMIPCCYNPILPGYCPTVKHPAMPRTGIRHKKYRAGHKIYLIWRILISISIVFKKSLFLDNYLHQLQVVSFDYVWSCILENGSKRKYSICFYKLYLETSL